ncbi:MAG: hypothetical protein HY291_13705 [Planctomycetes bacterium]|nr:hypothetical protein [Planctomycetota bacterium]
MKTAYLAFAGLALLGLSGLVRAETIDNPEYKHWSQYKAGTWVTWKQTTDAAGNKSVTETTLKLVEVNADKAVIETLMKMEVAGQKIEQPAQKRDVPAKIEKPAPVKQEEVKDAPKPKEGEDTVTVAGKALKCKTIETTLDAAGQKGTTKAWTSDEVPGQMVKSETKTPQVTMTMELVGFEKK